MIKIIKLVRNFVNYFKILLIFKIIKNNKFRVLRRIADSSHYLENKPKITSVIFWTTHKCASTYISKFLNLISKESNLNHFDYAGQIWELGNEIKLKYPFNIEQNCDFLYRKKGEIYGPMRMPFEFDTRSQLNNIFFLRDPRDLIISNFYSIAYSHPIPSNKFLKKNFLRKRRLAKKIGINNFFLKQIDDWIIPCYTNYKIMRENSKISSFYKYEDLKKNPKKVFSKISKKMNNNISQKFINKLSYNFEKPFKKKITNKKNFFLHTRSGANRQFEKELKKNVLLKGNKKLTKILKYWNFKI